MQRLLVLKGCDDGIDTHHVRAACIAQAILQYAIPRDVGGPVPTWNSFHAIRNDDLPGSQVTRKPARDPEADDADDTFGRFASQRLVQPCGVSSSGHYANTCTGSNAFFGGDPAYGKNEPPRARVGRHIPKRVSTLAARLRLR
jgi:hypothetical protein